MGALDVLALACVFKTDGNAKRNDAMKEYKGFPSAGDRAAP